MKYRFQRILTLFTLLIGSISAWADLVVKVCEPKIIASKAVVKLEMKNTFTGSIQSARATVFLLDDHGKPLGQSTKWVIGGTGQNTDKGQPPLPSDKESEFNFVISLPKFNTFTNLQAKVNFTRVVLDSGNAVNIAKNVNVRPATK